MRVGIVGCGTAGPAAGAFLARMGHDVHLFERAAPLRAVGAGILLQPTGLAVLQRLGMESAARQRGSTIRSLYGDTIAGAPVLELEYAWLHPHCSALGVHRAMLLELLLSAASREGVTVHAGKEVVDFGNIADPRLAFRDGGEFPCDLCIVASGARSILRQHAAFGTHESEYPWGALWAVQPDPNRAFGDTLRQVYDNAQRMVGFLPSGNAAASGPDSPTVSMFWSERVADLPRVRAGSLEDWKSRVRSMTTLADPVLASIRSWDDLASAAYVSVTLRNHWAGRVVVIGDAAHAMSPQLGQGANLALLDAATLADAINAHHHLPDALDAYADARRRHVRFYQWASRMLTPLFQGERESIGPVRDALMHRLSTIPWFRQQFLDSLAGVKTGIFSRLPDSAAAPLHRAQQVP
jgi:2-polyprenyl-6-methoxyphenol hydroxylase-like FAD-dependent oxidoreductase